MSPEMQCRLVVVDVLAFWRVKLNDDFFFVPKQIFDVSHLWPVGTAVHGADADADVFPTLSVRISPVAGDDQELRGARACDHERAVQAIAWI